MAKGRTTSAKFLTKKDKSIIDLCKEISDKLKENIDGKENKKDFNDKWGKINYSRDGGNGLGGGKLQRDTLCTRGRGGKAPFSNRNLRWHPFVVANNAVSYAKEIEEIKVDGKVLIFVVKDANGEKQEYPSDKVHELKERYVVTSEKWEPHVSELREWNDTEWTKNSCVIPSMEACNWEDAVETYAALGISVAVALYDADFEKTYTDVVNILKSQTIDEKIHLPSEKFPKEKQDMICCPMAKRPINQNLDYIRKEAREDTWQPNWITSKRKEGEDSSLQIMHINPLVEKEMRHKADNVRYGFRWCNVAMTDHSLDETLSFMGDILKAHGRI